MALALLLGGSTEAKALGFVFGPLGYIIGDALFRDPPKTPSPTLPLKQARPTRFSGTGRELMSGSYMLYEAVGNRSYDVFALHHGRIDGFERYFLHDDEVTIDGSGWVQDPGASQYSPNHVKILTRLGLPTETAYAEPIAALPDGTWTANHRGDGIASLYLYCDTGEEKYFREDFPNGLPLPSAVGRLSRVYDPREAGQDPSDEDTWVWSENGVVNFLWYLCFADGGPRLDYATRILPAIDYWIAAADICDEAIALKAGGTEPRYRQGGIWGHGSDPADVIKQYLECFDGWMSSRGDGALVIFAGSYYEPEVTFTRPYVTGYSFQRFAEDEQAVNSLIVSFKSPDHKFTEVECDPWKDESDITARGVERSERLSLPWVKYNGQARRLAKRKMSRLGASLRGTVRTNLYGLRGLGERYIRLQLDDVPGLSDVVVEIIGVEIDLASLALTFKWVAADPDIDAWNPATEEGEGPSIEARVPKEPLVAPAVLDVTTFFDSLGPGDGARLRVQSTGPDRTDLTWYVGWRRAGSVSWVESESGDFDPSNNALLETGFVPAAADLEVRVSYRVSSGATSPWSEPYSAPSDAPTGGQLDFSRPSMGGLLPLIA